MNEVCNDLHNQIGIPNSVDKLGFYNIQFLNFPTIIYILQFRSSDESLQSAIRLQRHEFGIQRPPVSHLHSFIPQASKINYINFIDYNFNFTCG